MVQGGANRSHGVLIGPFLLTMESDGGSSKSGAKAEGIVSHPDGAGKGGGNGGEGDFVNKGKRVDTPMIDTLLQDRHARTSRAYASGHEQRGPHGRGGGFGVRQGYRGGRPGGRSG